MRKKTKRRLLIVVLGVGVMVGVGMLKVRREAAKAPVVVAMISARVPVLMQDVPANQRLHSEDWQWQVQQVPEKDMSAYITFTHDGEKQMQNVKIVRAMKKTNVLKKMDVITVADHSQYGSKLASGERAFALMGKQVDQDTLKTVTAGDRVDVMWYQPKVGQAIRILTACKVLSVGNGHVVLALKSKAIALLMNAKQRGRLALFVRSQRGADTDKRTVWPGPEAFDAHVREQSVPMAQPLFHVRGTSVTRDTLVFEAPSE